MAAWRYLGEFRQNTVVIKTRAGIQDNAIGQPGSSTDDGPCSDKDASAKMHPGTQDGVGMNHIHRLSTRILPKAHKKRLPVPIVTNSHEPFAASLQQFPAILWLSG
jgi:hypothetical protein